MCIQRLFIQTKIQMPAMYSFKAFHEEDMSGVKALEAGPFIQKLDANLVLVILDLAYITAVCLSTQVDKA